MTDHGGEALPPPRRVTIRSVAADAGVSYQTVSRVLNGRADVAEGTRERVKAAMRALDYRPSLAARSLTRGRSGILAVVLPYGADVPFYDPYLLDVLRGITGAADASGNRVLLSTPTTATRVRAIEQLSEESFVDGVLIDGGMGEAGLSRLVGGGPPLVVMGYTRHPVCQVHPADDAAAYSVTQHLLALRHERIGVLAGPGEDEIAVGRRWEGVHRALGQAGVDLEDGLVEAGDWTALSGELYAESLLAMPRPPTAVLAFNDRMALGIIRRVRRAGWDVPGRLSVTGFDDVHAARVSTPPLTTVHLGSEDVGRTAVRMLLDCIDDSRRRLPQEVTLPAHLVVRESTAPPNRP